jgi:hypothetical protein
MSWVHIKRTEEEQHQLDVAIGRRDFAEDHERIAIAWSRIKKARRLQRGLVALENGHDDLRTRLTHRLLIIVRNMVLHFDQDGPVHSWVYCVHELVENHVRLIGAQLWRAYGKTIPNILEQVGLHWALPSGVCLELDFMWDEIPQSTEAA